MSIEFKTVNEVLCGRDMQSLQSVLIEKLRSMVARDWNDEEKARLPSVTAEVLAEKEADYCVHEKGRVGVPIDVWMVTCKKPTIM